MKSSYEQPWTLDEAVAVVGVLGGTIFSDSVHGRIVNDTDTHDTGMQWATDIVQKFRAAEKMEQQ